GVFIVLIVGLLFIYRESACPLCRTANLAASGSRRRPDGRAAPAGEAAAGSMRRPPPRPRSIVVVGLFLDLLAGTFDVLAGAVHGVAAAQLRQHEHRRGSGQQDTQDRCFVTNHGNAPWTAGWVAAINNVQRCCWARRSARCSAAASSALAALIAASRSASALASQA